MTLDDIRKQLAAFVCVLADDRDRVSIPIGTLRAWSAALAAPVVHGPRLEDLAVRWRQQATECSAEAVKAGVQSQPGHTLLMATMTLSTCADELTAALRDAAQRINDPAGPATGAMTRSIDIARKLADRNPWHYSTERGCDVCMFCGLDRSIVDFPDTVVPHNDYGVECIWQQARDISDGMAVTTKQPLDELAMLVGKLAHSLKRANPNSTLAVRAVDYLRRHDLLGSPLRHDAAAHESAEVEPRSQTCQNCGSGATTFSLDDGRLYCDKCGNRIDGHESAEAAGEQSAAPPRDTTKCALGCGRAPHSGGCVYWRYPDEEAPTESCPAGAGPSAGDYLYDAELALRVALGHMQDGSDRDLVAATIDRLAAAHPPLLELQAEPVASSPHDVAFHAMRIWLQNSAFHGEGCYLRDDGEYNQCFCGLDSVLLLIDEAEEHAAQERPPAERAQVPRDASVNDMRVSLVIQIDELIDVAERYVGRMEGIDPDEQKRTLGAIEYARKVSAPYRYNGPYRPAARCATCCEPIYRDATGATRCGCLDLVNYAKATP